MITLGIYVFCWLSFCVLNIFWLIKNPHQFSLTHKRYWLFLAVPWKLITFFIAATGLIFIAPYTGDPTWDWVDASFMAVLTFTTAPWSLGVLYRHIKQLKVSKQFSVALALWFFSASWSYDGYLLIRDGVYPITWFSNIFASSILYICAGLLWNLDHRPGRGITFAFMECDWFFVGSLSFTKIVWMALPFMLIVFVAIISFLF